MKSYLLGLLMLVASCGSMPAFAQDQLPPVGAFNATPDVPAPTEKSLKGFRKELLAQAQAACDRGEIEQAQVRKLRFTTLIFPQLTRNMHNAVSEELVVQSKTSVGALKDIDWAKWAEIIKTMLPVILQILSMFKGEPNLSSIDWSVTLNC